jgi:hypothetical protein
MTLPATTKKKAKAAKAAHANEVVLEELRQAWLQLGFAITALSLTTVAMGYNSANRDVMNDALRAVTRAHGHLMKARSISDRDLPELDAVLTPQGPLLALLSDGAALLVAVRDRHRLHDARLALARVFEALGAEPPDDLSATAATALTREERSAFGPDPVQVGFVAVAIAAVVWLLLR